MDLTNLDGRRIYGFHGYVPQHLFALGYAKPCVNMSVTRYVRTLYEILLVSSGFDTHIHGLVVRDPFEIAHLRTEFFREPIAQVRVVRVFDGFRLTDTLDEHVWLALCNFRDDFVLEYSPRPGTEDLLSISDLDARDAAVRAYKEALV